MATNWFQQHAPELLIGSGLAAGLGATATAFIVAPKVKDAVDKIKSENDGKAPVKEVIKATWKPMILPVALEATSIALTITGAAMRYKRGALAAAACVAAENTALLYKRKMEEILPEKDVQKIKQAVADEKAKEAVEKHDPDKESYVPVVENGRTLFIDGFTGQIFYHDIDKVRNAIRLFQEQVIEQAPDAPVELNDFYDLLGLRPCKVGYQYGFYVDAETGRVKNLDVTFGYAGVDGDRYSAHVLNYEAYLLDPF